MKHVHWNAIVDELSKCEGDWCWLIDHSVARAIKILVINHQKALMVWLLGVAGAIYARLRQYPGGQYPGDQDPGGNAPAQGAT